MPLCYGGGIKSIDQIKRLISLGVEKIAIGSAAIENQELIINAVKHFGSQSVVGVIDGKMTGLTRSPEVVIRNASKKTGMNPLTFALKLQELGVGEILLNSVDRDGKMNGYDLNLVSSIYGTVNIPLTVLGGAGLLKDIKELVKLFPVIGAAAGSLFVFKGKYRAVLINYPNKKEKEAIFLPK